MASHDTKFYIGNPNNEEFTISSDLPTVIDGREGNDWIEGSTSYDLIYGGPDRDLIFGGNSPDTIYGDWFDDPGQPGGDDFIIGDSASNGFAPTNPGRDYVIAGAGRDFVNGELANDSLYGGPGDDTMWGGEGNDGLFGGDGKDMLVGGSSTPPPTFTVVITQSGEDGSPYLFPFQQSSNGGLVAPDDPGADILNGGEGADTIRGQRGNDRLTGGPDKDKFVFETPLGPANVDVIRDFAKGDKIVLSNAVFRNIGVKLDAGEFRIGAKANDGNDRILYNRNDGGGLSFDADGKGGKGAVLFAKVGEGLNLSHSDFATLIL